MMNEVRDRYERDAQRLWRRWFRAARYALETTAVDAMLRYRLGSILEAHNAVRDLIAGPEGWVYMLQRARRTARLRRRRQVEDLVLRLAFSMPVAGRCSIALAVRRAGFAVSPSTVRRMLVRRGLWDGDGRVRVG